MWQTLGKHDLRRVFGENRIDALARKKHEEQGDAWSDWE
jgi:hypothetical protein